MGMPCSSPGDLVVDLSGSSQYLGATPRHFGRAIPEMGHAKVDTTLNVNAQVVDGSLRKAAETVGSELFTIVHQPESASASDSSPSCRTIWDISTMRRVGLNRST